MLNKIKKNILPMLDTLGDALAQYLSQPADELFSGIFQFIDAINAPLKGECEDAIELSEQLKASLKKSAPSEVEKLYKEYCTSIEKLPVQYKVVFLPYYDNTWDSLASVYKAFAADPMFITEIVIIPIRRNTPSGWKMIYEDYLTPVGIPNTHFSQYSFEEDLPDFVFYNNPYDGANIEKFQSGNIKLYAGCMIYIPYFLYQHLRHEKEELKKAVEQFTQLSGHDNADIFIVQGQSFFKTFAHRSRNGKKMVMLGNPKTDNIYSHMKEYSRYSTWDKATEGKTVFLLNTHYTDVINGKYKDSLPHLLECIEQREDLALIWRPHPQSFLMVGEGAKSEWQDYLERVDKHERMILDRTASDISAIMYSDAIFSQLSSLVSEAIFADKPVFLLTAPAQENIPADVWSGMPIEEYKRKMRQVREYDPKNLFLFSSVCYVGINDSITKKEDYTIKNIMFQFINDIKNGIDIKKDLRALFREKLFINRNGICGQAIHDYIASLIKS